MRKRQRAAGARKPARGAARRFASRALRWALLALAVFYASCTLALVGLRWIDPPFTSVHVQRRIESWFHKGSYRKRYSFAALASISPHLQHAVIAGEDTRFYEHHGFDWKEIENARDEYLERGRARGASTITQQLVKNLFLTTHHSAIRKALESPLVPLTEWILGKRRILELYLNVIEWGPGVYGAEAACRYHYHITAARVSREQSARLAACIPAPLKRKPERMEEYGAEILSRMGAMSW